MSEKTLKGVEKIKKESLGLRGTLKESLRHELTGALFEDDQSLIKFHGMYQQDDRDRREERSAKKLERLYSFMVRLRIPGGLLTAPQWVALNHIAGEYSTGVIKVTTRQTVQLHGILKRNIKPVLKDFKLNDLDAIAACGDVNRNVICTANPENQVLYNQILQLSQKISQLALPASRAYYEIFLDEEPLTDKLPEEDPLYRDRYLPRKFKVAIALPPENDVDVFANDVGIIVIKGKDGIAGYNILAGGGLGTTHGNTSTYPRLASMLGFVDTEEKLLRSVYEIIIMQRDFGNRDDRKLSRLKYTIDRMGLDAFKQELENRLGFELQAPADFHFTSRSENCGWLQRSDGHWNYALFIENGRITDEPGVRLKSGLLALAETGKMTFRFTANQNIILCGISPEDKITVAGILEQYGLLSHNQDALPMRRDAIACVAFNTCPLALAEAQRYLPRLIDKIHPLLERHGLEKEPVSIRMTGCPNGCGRPYLAEIGLVGTAYGRYNLHLGGDRLGARLNFKYRENIDEEGILATLNEAFNSYVQERQPEETFGDFSFRKWSSPSH